MSDIHLLKGSLDFDGIERLKVDNYQREVLSNTTAKALFSVLENGGDFLPVILGMRNQKFDTDRTGMVLHGDVYIIDGLQRAMAIKQFVSLHPEKKDQVKLDAKLFFDTTFETEKLKFHEYNIKRTTISPNIILRNCATSADPLYPALATLYSLSKEPPLHNRVQWTQSPDGGSIITATTIVRVMLTLFQHIVPPSGETSPLRTGVEHLIYPLEARVRTVKLPNFRKSVAEFFGLIDEHWGLQNLDKDVSRPHLRNTFLLPLATVFSDHHDFWKEGEKLLAIPNNLRKKLGTFPLAKAENMIRQSAGRGASSRDWMVELLTRHLNRGKSVKLHKRGV